MSDTESQRQKAAKAVHGITARRARRPHTAKKANRAPRVEAPVDQAALAFNDTLSKLDAERKEKKVTERDGDGSRKFFTDMDTHEANEKRLLKQAKEQHEQLHRRDHPRATKKKIAWGLLGSNRVWKKEDGTEVVIKGGRKRRSRARRRRRRTHRRTRRKKRKSRRRRNKKSRKRRRRK